MSNPTELLRRALDALELMYFCHADQKWISYGQQKEKIHQQAIAEINDIRAFLAAEPEAEPEPVAYLFDADSYCDHAPIKDELVQSLPKGILRQKIKNVRPLYTRPEQSRKPMTESELENLFRECHGNFEKVVRAIEKHHGVGGDDGQ